MKRNGKEKRKREDEKGYEEVIKELKDAVWRGTQQLDLMKSNIAVAETIQGKVVKLMKKEEIGRKESKQKERESKQKERNGEGQRKEEKNRRVDKDMKEKEYLQRGEKNLKELGRKIGNADEATKSCE